MSDYDPHFAANEAVLSSTYDFVTCTEVAEHLRRPIEVFERIHALLKPGGEFGLLTGVLEDDGAFPDWWYHRDPTHIAFYRPETVAWLADRFKWTFVRPSLDTVIFKRAET